MQLAWKHLVAVALLVLALFALLDWTGGTLAPSAPGSSASGWGGSPPANLSASAKALAYRRVPDWSSYQGVINGPNGSDSLSMGGLRGRVVLLDFWTYSCINCLRTLPYLTAWDTQYRHQGLAIVGIHTPEFDFEKERGNIERAVNQYGVNYPVVIDSDRRLWDLFGNNYWPRHYLVDREGYVREDHIGEGGYAETEKTIRELLAEGANESAISKMPLAHVSSEAADFGKINSPELYFGGSFRRAPIGNDGGKPTRPNVWRDFVLPDSSSIQPDRIYLSGRWNDSGQNMRMLSDEGDIVLKYSARAVHLVADSANANGSRLSLALDGQTYAGPEGENPAVSSSRLYRIINTSDYGAHTARIHIRGAGFGAYSFTFG